MVFVGMRRMLPLVVVGLVAASAASASSPRLVFDRTQATPHTLVLARTAGQGALLRARKRTVRAFFRANPLVPLGRVSVNRKGNGTLRVYVPNVSPGDYGVVLRGLPGTPALRPAGSFRVLDGATPRTCEQSVYGKLAEDSLSRAHTVGPLHFIGLDGPPARDRSTREYAMKVLLVVDRGPPLTLAVAPEDRALVALTYIPGRFNIRRVIDQDAAVTFEPCSGDETTQFNGGFVFRRPLCAHFTVEVGTLERVGFALPLGAPCGAEADVGAERRRALLGTTLRPATRLTHSHRDDPFQHVLELVR
jgi:hypothetical protein